MTEAEWLESSDPVAMLAYLPRVVSDRKLRRFAMACCDRYSVDSPLDPERDASSGALDWALAWARAGRQSDGGLYNYRSGQSEPDVRAALLHDLLGNPFHPTALVWKEGTAYVYTPLVPGDTTRGVTLYLDGNRYRVVRWLTPTVLALAQEVYKEHGRKCERCNGSGQAPITVAHVLARPITKKVRCSDCYGTGRIGTSPLDQDLLLVLSDAMEDAGCSNPGILNHLRNRRLHIRGCWAIDLLLGVE